MRVTFLTGSLEPGKDGVGDYTRLLAQECTRAGVLSQAIALADRHVERSVQTTAAEGVEVLRLPDSIPWTARIDDAARRIRAFEPDWVSVQFVPFSYHRWGVARELVVNLPRLVGRARLHVMLHEIWIGPDGSWRRRLVSAAQRRYVRQLCARPNAMIHTSNSAYRQMLTHYGVTADVLPLFGNIAVSGTDGWHWLGPRLQAAGCSAATHRQDWWLCVMFGALHPVWPPEPLFGRLADAARAAGKRVAVMSVGRLAGGESLWGEIAARYGSHMPMVQLGEQTDTRVSEVLGIADFGIATSPYSLLGKSGTVAAMLEHGLPVIVNRDDGWPGDAAGDLDSSRVVRLDGRFGERLAAVPRLQVRPRRPEIASRFLGDLAAALS
jgi:hypothetical protein